MSTIIAHVADDFDDSADNCVAFEVFLGAGYPGQCYLFLGNMSLPFTASESVTCVLKQNGTAAATVPSLAT